MLLVRKSAGRLRLSGRSRLSGFSGLSGGCCRRRSSGRRLGSCSFSGFALFLRLHLRFGNHVCNVFLHAFDGGERLFAQIDAAREKIRRQGLHVKLAARDDNGAKRAERNAAKEEKTVFDVLVDFEFVSNVGRRRSILRRRPISCNLNCASCGVKKGGRTAQSSSLGSDRKILCRRKRIAKFF